MRFHRLKDFFLRPKRARRAVVGALALVLAASVAVPLALVGGTPPPPTVAAPGDPIVGNPGVPVDAAAVDYEIRRYEQYIDPSWSAILETRSGAVSATSASYPHGRFPQGTSGYFNQVTPALPVSSTNTVTGSRTRDHVLFFPRVLDLTDPWNPLVVSPSKIRFGGYYRPPWFDYVYTEQLNIQSIDFDIVPQLWDFHTLKRMGFFFLCQRSPTPTAPTGSTYHAHPNLGASNYDTSNGLISGYMLSIGAVKTGSSFANALSAGYHSTITGPSYALINFELYYVQDMSIDAYNAYVKSQNTARLTTGQTNFTTPANTAPAGSAATGLDTYGNTANLSAYGFPNSNINYTNGTGPVTAASVYPSIIPAAANAANVGGSLPRCATAARPISIARWENSLAYPSLAADNNPRLPNGSPNPNYNPYSPAIPDSRYGFQNATATVGGVTTREVGTASRQGKMHFELRITDTDFEVWLTDVDGVRNLNGATNGTGTGNPAPLNNNQPFLLFRDTFATLNPPGSPTPATNIVSRPVTGNGFGLYMQNYDHSCSQLTVAEFQDFTVTQKNEPTPVRPQVDFVDASGNPIRGTYTYHSDLWSTDTFDVEPPPSITTTGPNPVTYYYFSSDRDGRTYPNGGSGHTNIPVDVNDNSNNHTTLTYVLAPVLQKDAWVLENDGSWTPRTAPNAPENGAPQHPVDFPYTDRLKYTITLTNPNQTALSGVTMQLSDVLPPGLRYIPNSAVPALVNEPPTQNSRDQDELLWNIASIPANNAPLTFTVIAEVEPPGYGITFVNGADLLAPTTGLRVHSNRVYHRATLADVIASKEARIRNPDGTYPSGYDNGDPVRKELKLGDTLKYTLKFNNPNPRWGGNAYDVIYALDWSNSMGATYRAMAKEVADLFSQKLLDTYPNSRISLMGMNLPIWESNGGYPEHLFLQVDSPFTDEISDLTGGNTYPINNSDVAYGGDDGALFLRAAIDKQLGLFNSYGGGGPVLAPLVILPPNDPLPPWEADPVPVTTVNARLDQSRIPVIIQVSDWELFGANSSAGGNLDPYYWSPQPPLPSRFPPPAAPTPGSAWERMEDQLQRFKAAYDNTVFIGVGFDNGSGSGGSTWYSYNGPKLGGPLGLINTIGGGDWDYINANNFTGTDPLKTPAENVATKLWNQFELLAPLDPGYGIITDPLPVGLTAQLSNINVTLEHTITHAITNLVTNGVIVDPNVESVTVFAPTDLLNPYPGQYTVQVKFKEFPTGEIKVDIICTPDVNDFDEATYLDLATKTYLMDNHARVEYRFEGHNGTEDTNETHHGVKKYEIIEQFHDDLEDPPLSGSYLKIWDPIPALSHTFYGGQSWTPSASTTVSSGTFPGIGPGPFNTPQSRWINGHEYTWITNVYKLDSDTALHTAWNTAITGIVADHVVIYPYNKGPETSFNVTEKFLKIEDDTHVNATTNPDIPNFVLGGNDFDLTVGLPPMNIVDDDGNTYAYVGFKTDNGTIRYELPPAPPGHLLEYVITDHTITYFYARLARKTAVVYEEGVTLSPDDEQTGSVMVPVIARPGDPAISRNDDEIDYRIYLNIPTGLQNSGETITVTDVLPQGLEYVSSNPAVTSRSTANPGTTSVIETVGWTFPADSITSPLTVRVKVITRPPPANNFVNQAVVTLDDRPYIPPYNTNYTYHSNVLPGPRTLHIRQIILDPSGAPLYAELPPVGFFTAANGTGGSLTNTSLLSTSGPQAALGTLPFTIYTFPDSPDPLYRVETIVPQYYECVNFQLAHTPIPHVLTPTPSPALRRTRPIPINFLDEREYWLTVYLRPKPLNTAQYAWDFRTNVIGLIYPPPIVTPQPTPQP